MTEVTLETVTSPRLTFEQFLLCATGEAWIQAALENIGTLLIDHAHCEKKAASSALALMYRYPDKVDLCQAMSRLAREELRHFEQVLALMTKMGIKYSHLQPARYAGGLRELIDPSEPQRLIDTLICGAFIEARSAERFAKLIPYLSGEMKIFYSRLLKSEARHYENYLQLATRYSSIAIDRRVSEFAAREAELISTADDIFRFHSGTPLGCVSS